MFTKRAKETADACRFCWMCRHICPVGLVTGREGNTPRAKGLLVSMDVRGFPLEEDGMELMYQCSLCGACASDCVTGYDPRLYIREGRAQATASGLLPSPVRAAVDRALAGEPTAVDRTLKEAIETLPETAEVLVYLGGDARKEGKSALALFKVLKAAGISFTVLKDEPDSGARLGDLIGYVEEVRQAAKLCLDAIKAAGPSTVVVLDPFCLSFFRHQCAEWELLPETAMVTATAFCAELVKEGRLKLRALGGTATFHDPCHLARDLGETDCARELLGAMGIEIKEMFLTGNMSKCCGGPVLRETYPEITAKMALARWDDAARAGAETMITACPGCARILGENTPEGYCQEDIYQLLAEASEQ